MIYMTLRRCSDSGRSWHRVCPLSPVMPRWSVFAPGWSIAWRMHVIPWMAVVGLCRSSPMILASQPCWRMRYAALLGMPLGDQKAAPTLLVLGHTGDVVCSLSTDGDEPHRPVPRDTVTLCRPVHRYDRTASAL